MDNSKDLYKDVYLRGVNTRPQFVWCECVFGYSGYKYDLGKDSYYNSCVFQPPNPSQILSNNSGMSTDIIIRFLLG